MSDNRDHDVQFGARYGLMVQSDRPHHEPPSSWIAIYEGAGPETAMLGRRIRSWWLSEGNETWWSGSRHRSKAESALRNIIHCWEKENQ